MATEILFLGHDNTIDLVLKADGAAVDLAAVTAITATFNGTTVESTDKAAGAITWDQGGYDTGEIRMALGGETITPGTYDVAINVKDPSNTEGIAWGYVRIEVVAEFET